jgi:hypothetical protein
MRTRERLGSSMTWIEIKLLVPRAKMCLNSTSIVNSASMFVNDLMYEVFRCGEQEPVELTGRLSWLSAVVG